MARHHPLIRTAAYPPSQAGHPWVGSVMWHPELIAASESTRQRLFDALVAASDRAPTRTRGGNP